MNYVEIGKRIKCERKKLKITREKFAEILNLSINYLGQIERGEKKFSAETIVKIADSLHVSLDYLIRGEVSSSNPEQLNRIGDILVRCSKSELAMITDVIMAIVPHLKTGR